jgi:hypothetical protein
MGISNAQNLNTPLPVQRPYGVRVSLRPGDPFRKLLGDDWSRAHWFATVSERDAALDDMSRRHEYSRAGDAPALHFERIEDAAGADVRSR